MAWLHSTPKPPVRPKKVSSAPERELTRGEKIEANGGTPLFPEVDAAYLIQHWFSVGLTGHGAMGPTALSALELMAWQQGTGVDLVPWEFRVLREMSRAYVAQYHDSEEPACPPPYGEQAKEYDRDAVAKKISDIFKARLARK